jgi:hypothetical protein
MTVTTDFKQDLLSRFVGTDDEGEVPVTKDLGCETSNEGS